MTQPDRNHDQRSEKRKMPEFIYVDPDVETEREAPDLGGFGQEYFTSFQTFKKKDSSIMVRVVSFFGALILLGAVILGLPFFLLFLALNLITFFKMKPFWEQTIKLWEYIKRVLAVIVGLFVAVFSPSFGLTIIMVYFLLQGQRLENQFMMKLMKSRFED